MPHGRKLHIDAVKAKALAILDAGDCMGAYHAVVDGLRERTDTVRLLRPVVMAGGRLCCETKNYQGMRRWIEAFR